MRILLLSLLLSSIALSDDFTDLSGAGENRKTDQLTFTGTQRWGKEFERFLRQRPKFLSKNWNKSIVLPAPPANSSPRTKAEIAYLKTLAPKRQEKASEIQAEVLVTNFRFGKHDYATLTTAPQYRETGKLIVAAYHDLAIATFQLKKQFNRVRPSILDRNLGHAISIPTHPAYPSGHATAVYSIAYLLQELDPAAANIYHKDAKRISDNREIAGLHYPSDSEAGRLLARQIIDQLLSNSSFKRQLQNAKSEWP